MAEIDAQAEAIKDAQTKERAAFVRIFDAMQVNEKDGAGGDRVDFGASNADNAFLFALDQSPVGRASGDEIATGGEGTKNDEHGVLQMYNKETKKFENITRDQKTAMKNLYSELAHPTRPLTDDDYALLNQMMTLRILDQDKGGRPQVYNLLNVASQKADLTLNEAGMQLTPTDFKGDEVNPDPNTPNRIKASMAIIKMEVAQKFPQAEIDTKAEINTKAPKTAPVGYTATGKSADELDAMSKKAKDELAEAQKTRVGTEIGKSASKETIIDMLAAALKDKGGTSVAEFNAKAEAKATTAEAKAQDGAAKPIAHVYIHCKSPEDARKLADTLNAEGKATGRAEAKAGDGTTKPIVVIHCDSKEEAEVLMAKLHADFASHKTQQLRTDLSTARHDATQHHPDDKHLHIVMKDVHDIGHTDAPSSPTNVKGQGVG